METIEKLSSSLDFTDYASQIIHALIQVQLPHNAITTFIVPSTVCLSLHSYFTALYHSCIHKCTCI